LTRTLEVLHSTSKVWQDWASEVTQSDYVWLVNFDGSSAAFDVAFTSDLGTDWHGKTVSLRFKTIDANSVYGAVYDQFTVNFHYECLDDQLTLASANDIGS